MMSEDRIRFFREYVDAWLPKWFDELIVEIDRLRNRVAQLEEELSRLEVVAALETEFSRLRPRFRGDSATRHAEEIAGGDNIERGEE